MHQPTHRHPRACGTCAECLPGYRAGGYAGRTSMLSANRRGDAAPAAGPSHRPAALPLEPRSQRQTAAAWRRAGGVRACW